MARVIEQAGVSVAPTGSTGVQVNEFEAAIKSVTSSTTVGAVFVYDTRNDSDSGAWRKKTQGLSWYDEDLNTATRGGRREFPSVALIVSDSVSGVTVYDLDDPAMPMWMVFNGAYADRSTKMLWHNTSGGLFALNGRVWLGRSWVNFAEDSGGYYQWNDNFIYTGGIADRHSTTAISSGSERIVHNTVNDVAATYLEGGELDSLGLVRPLAALATDGGVSVIHPNGSVCDGHAAAKTKVDFTSNGSLLIGRNDSTSSYFSVVPKGNYFADGFTEVDFELSYAEQDNASAASYIPNFLGSNPQLAALDNDGIAVGCDVGLNIYKHNSGNKNESAVAYITSTYNTGYMLGDIRLAVAAIKNSTVTAYDETGNFGDRSVKGNTLTNNGTITCTPVATGAEAYGLSGFDGSNYLTRAYDADFDFGTGDFSIMFWVKFSENSVYDVLISREYHTGSAYSGNGFQIETGGNNAIALKDSSGTEITKLTGDSVFGQWRQIIFTRRSSNFYAYRDGVLIDGPDANTTNFDNSNAVLEIGKRVGSTSLTADKSSLSLVRISATAPTPQQVKEIYEAEKPLFREGAKCLLAANQVNDLAYDSSTDLLHVASESTSSSKSFRGLEAVESLTSDGSFGLAASKPLDYVAASGGVVAGVGGDTSDADTSGCGVNLPAIDVRGDINTADTKLPDDGKIHFSGVTTNATPTVIGHIPIAEDEHLYIKSVVNAGKYNAKTSERASFEVDAQFVRKIGDDVNSPTELRKLSDEQYSTTFDVVWERDTASNTARLKVTGVAGMRFEWSADITVQRISEKTYER